jgi:hypothetical protein
MKTVFRFLMILSSVGLIVMTSCEPSTNRAKLEMFSQALLPYIKNSKLIQVSSADSTRGNNDRITIPAGQIATVLDVSGPGVITRIWFTIDSRDPNYLRTILIRMYWDDEKTPSVEVPFGDFFGTGFSYEQNVSQYLGMTSGGFVTYFPMPFEKSAKIQIVNQSGQDVYAFYYQIDYQKLEGYLDRDVAYFHAWWHRDIRTDYDSNYTILNTTGRGHVVGVNLNLQSYDGTFAFLEGNEMIWVDGEVKPSIVGTGTEDYFSSGWYFNKGVFSAPYHGLILKDDSLGRIAAYRLHVMDPIPFKKSINFTIEHGQGNTEIADYSSTVYWYQLEPHKPFPPMPKAGMRIPLKVVTPNRIIEAENMVFGFGRIPTVVEDVSSYGPDWSGGKQLLIRGSKGNTFSLDLKGLFESTYSLDLYYTQGPDYGNVSILDGDVKIGEINGYFPVLRAGGKVSLNGIRPTYGKIPLTFRVDGKDPSSSGFKIGLDGIFLNPKRSFIPDWYIIGPFPNPRKTESQRRGLDSIYKPEVMIDTNASYIGVNGKPIHWQYVKTPENGYISLKDKVNPSELVVTYALTYIFSEQDKKVLLVIGSDDGAKVFFNDKQVYRFLGVRIAEPDQVTIPVHVLKGWNKLLLKVENNLGGYAFYARLIDPGNTLYMSAKMTNPASEWFGKD